VKIGGESSRAACKMRTAISPLLATRSFFIMIECADCDA
jgi:ribosomal protein S27E